jgi:hypothetical protein
MVRGVKNSRSEVKIPNTPYQALKKAQNQAEGIKAGNLFLLVAGYGIPDIPDSCAPDLSAPFASLSPGLPEQNPIPRTGNWKLVTGTPKPLSCTPNLTINHLARPFAVL